MIQQPHLTVSSSPHIKGEDNTRSIMLDVCIALVFPLAIACYFFGLRALLLALVSVVSCVLFEWLYRKLMHKTSAIGDLSAVVTGLLIAFGLPVSVPYWIPIVGAFFAIVIAKQLYGGLGKNWINPALAARVFLFLSFPAYLDAAAFTPALLKPGLPLWGTIDAVSAATPLAFMQNGQLPLRTYTLQELFLGQIPGCLGEVSAVILLVSGLYLLLRRVITPRIPLAYLGTVALCAFAFPRGDGAAWQWVVCELLSGGLILGAVFMATDFSTSPVTPRGQWIFGVGCGLLTVLIRVFGAYPEGVSFAILIMNSCVWFLDKMGLPRRFGVRWFTRKKEGAS